VSEKSCKLGAIFECCSFFRITSRRMLMSVCRDAASHDADIKRTTRTRKRCWNAAQSRALVNTNVCTVCTWVVGTANTSVSRRVMIDGRSEMDW